MASPDTIVPDLANPQSYNRYSYVNNNPLKYRDPSGHRACSDAYSGSPCQPESIYSVRFSSPFFNFSGEVTAEEMAMADRAARDIGQRIADEVNFIRRLEGKTQLSAAGAFTGVFDGKVNMHRYADRPCTVGPGCRAWVQSSQTIYIGQSGFTNHQNIVHEIFHIFDLVMLNGAANQALALAQEAGTVPDRPDIPLERDEEDRIINDPRTWGFADGNFSDWQKSRSGLPGEEFADMGIGWVYNQWEPSPTGGWSNDGIARANFMDVNMDPWLNHLLP